jgi:hypothetical protein
VEALVAAIVGQAAFRVPVPYLPVAVGHGGGGGGGLTIQVTQTITGPVYCADATEFGQQSGTALARTVDEYLAAERRRKEINLGIPARA